MPSAGCTTPRHDLRLDSEADAIEAMEEYRAAGGVSVVEATPIGLGRDPEGLRRISRASGVNVVMGSSFYYRSYHPDWLDDMTVDQLTELIVDDVIAGVGNTGVKANTDNLRWTEDADRVLDGQGRVGPHAVGGAFDVVVAHLSADDAGVGA
jgi:hypothetical protein